LIFGLGIFGKILNGSIWPAARYGGEELTLLLPGADTDSASLVAENVRRAVENLGMEL
jgi:PleD family two-component response regulator